jgi:EAL domain-containing protein (putative c-di-GMP-specific phosphodiesterase class I)
MSRLRDHPITTLKVDKSFIDPLTRQSDDDGSTALLTSILELGRALGLQLVAEGVETGRQLDVLRALGCPEAQGYLFARPADPGVITNLVAGGIALADPAPLLGDDSAAVTHSPA